MKVSIRFYVVLKFDLMIISIIRRTQDTKSIQETAERCCSSRTETWSHGIDTWMWCFWSNRLWWLAYAGEFPTHYLPTIKPTKIYVISLDWWLLYNYLLHQFVLSRWRSLSSLCFLFVVEYFLYVCWYFFFDKVILNIVLFMFKLL